MNKCKSKQSWVRLCMAGIKTTKGNVSSNTKNVGTSLAITFVPIHIGHPVAGHHHYTLGTRYGYNKSDRKVTYTRNGSVISALLWVQRNKFDSLLRPKSGQAGGEKPLKKKCDTKISKIRHSVLYSRATK